MLSEQFDSLLLNVNLISLIVDKVTSVNHPEVEIDIDLKLLSLGLRSFL